MIVKDPQEGLRVNTTGGYSAPMTSSPTRATSPTLMAVRAAIDAENAAATPSSQYRGIIFLYIPPMVNLFPNRCFHGYCREREEGGRCEGI